MMKIAIAGATGRMGKMLIEAVLNCTDAELVGALEHESCPLLGEDAGAFLGKKTGVAITSDIEKALSGAEFLGIQNEFGSIEKGKKPGLVLLGEEKRDVIVKGVL